MKETSPDEDVLALDCDLRFAEGNVGIQVKCTSGRQLVGTKDYHLPVLQKWVDNWEKCLNPIYVVLVIVPKDVTNWLDHPADSTVHRTGAFWARIVPANIKSSIIIPRSQRLTAMTLLQWRQEMISAYTPAGAP